MSRKVRVGSLIGLFVLVWGAVGVLVWPTPKPAMATNRYVQAHLIWNGGEPYDVAMVATLYDAAFQQLGVLVQLSHDLSFEYWEDYIDDLGQTGATVVFSWDYIEDDLHWHVNQVEDDPPVTVNYQSTGTYLTAQLD